MASRSWRLTAHRNPIEVCLLDLRVNGATPTSPASDSEPEKHAWQSLVSVSGDAAPPAPRPGAASENVRVGMSGQLGGHIGLRA
jgi:hypothetical protein